MSDTEGKVKHISDLNRIEERLVKAFDLASGRMESHHMGQQDRALFATATAELARSIIELRKQREFEALPQKDKQALKIPVKSKSVP